MNSFFHHILFCYYIWRVDRARSKKQQADGRQLVDGGNLKQVIRLDIAEKNVRRWSVLEIVHIRQDWAATKCRGAEIGSVWPQISAMSLTKGRWYGLARHDDDVTHAFDEVRVCGRGGKFVGHDTM